MKQKSQQESNIKGKLLISLVLSQVLLFSNLALAHNKVVVVPLGGDESPLVRPNSELYINSIGMEFSLIPAGSFVMGSPDGTGDTSHRPVNNEELDRANSERQHIVNISKNFYMQTTEVTQAQYLQVMGNNPAHFSVSGPGADCGLDCPVERVSWNDAQNFINALNASENRINCNAVLNTCYSLPTESQWEYAARGATVSAFYNGAITTDIGNDPNLNLIAWYFINSDNTTHPVAQKAPNQWGLYDMSGNVGEWCEDFYADYPDGPVTDPVGPASTSSRTLRGGSWLGDASGARSASRGAIVLNSSGYTNGFRIVLPSS